MNKIYYFDHAATSFPKAPGVGDAMKYYIDEVGANINRSTYAASTRAATVALETREQLCALFHFGEVTHALFTPGQTYSLNLVIRGLLEDGGHAIVSSMEHNAVMRPLTQLAGRGVSFSRIDIAPNGTFDFAGFERAFCKDTRLCVMTHASNVSGTLLPIERIGRICRAHDVPLLLDAAQTAGHVPIDFCALGLSALAVPGHKGLLGPGGIGALLIEPALAKRISPLVTGGTGSASDSEQQPDYMPDRFESGTLNLPGVYGLHAALGFVQTVGVEALGREQRALTERFLSGLAQIPFAHVHGTGEAYGRVGVVSCTFDGLDSADVAYRLENEFGILTRCGLHCAPSAHRSLGTFPQGTVRFSFGYGNAASDVDAALNAIERLL